MPLIKDIDLENTSLDFSGNICGACYREIAIDSNGDIYPCQSLIIKTYRIANILNNSNWYEMLNQSFITNTFRNATINNIVECSDCKIKYLCGGGCRAIPIKIEGNAFLKAKAICKYQKSIVNSKLKRLLSDFEYKHCHE